MSDLMCHSVVDRVLGDKNDGKFQEYAVSQKCNPAHAVFFYVRYPDGAGYIRRSRNPEPMGRSLLTTDR